MITLPPVDNVHRDGNYHVISGDISDCRLKSRASNAFSIPSSAASSVNYIEHHVSKMDTLAGVAIKYGVEVSDIKRLNGLVTDLHMFAHKSLQIPLPGRHPPSPILSNGSTTQENGSNLRTPPWCPLRDLYKDFQSLEPHQRNVSAAMSILQSYYGLAPPLRNGNCGEDTELSAYKINGRGSSTYEALPWESEGDKYLGKKRSSRSMADGYLAENGGVHDIDRERLAQKSVQRRQKSNDDLSPQTPELILKDDNSGGFFTRLGNGLALRPKSASRSNLIDMDTATHGHADHAYNSNLPDGYAGVQRSSSTSSMQNPVGGAAISWSASKWTLKPDLQVLSAVAIPIFDGLALPISSKHNKASMD